MSFPLIDEKDVKRKRKTNIVVIEIFMPLARALI